MSCKKITRVRLSLTKPLHRSFVLGSSKINLTARIPKTEIYSSLYYLVFLKRCCYDEQFSTAEKIM